LPEEAERALSWKNVVTTYNLDLNHPRNTRDALSLEQLRRIKLAEHAEQYVQEQQRERSRNADRPESFGSVSESRADAFS